ncbi:unnamed protein product [Cyprideis torosa]|uniref:Uncharacterized protein n=1 Tax=Cyprideis torosa TaxID=163714 RepID=A0A7R8WEN0_9CRUS|nr:unnamed protein product [Cyprideis torosa]CAG0895831.1 unnamed protein product [Cyprideis torosa]
MNKIQDKELAAKIRAKANYDEKHRAQPLSPLAVGTHVMIRGGQVKPRSGIVVEKTGERTYRVFDGQKTRQSLEKFALTMRIAQRSRTPCVKQAAASATQASFNRSSSASMCKQEPKIGDPCTSDQECTVTIVNGFCNPVESQCDCVDGKVEYNATTCGDSLSSLRSSFGIKPE